mgnify:CR=1 FL=1|jgi:Beta-xylosidase
MRLQAKTPENAIRHVHDPCIARHDGHYYLFSTGHGVPIRRSRDLIHWEFLGQVFPEPLPAWAAKEIPGSVFPWAPDIALLDGRYHLYYSISTFGKNRSAIGLATNRTLDPAHRDYAWRDEGKVFESSPGDDYNAIDANVFNVVGGKRLFLFGSFWGGIQMVEMDPRTNRPRPGAPVRTVARRPPPGAVEAPFLTRRGDFFYLFVSFDVCCRGGDSTYNIRVGRARAADGPYVDRAGKPLLEGGGTVVLEGEPAPGRVAGPGHCAVLREWGRDLLVHHFYDRAEKGVPTLQIRPLVWDRDGWPTAGPSLAPL